MSDYYDREGRPIDLEEWAVLHKGEYMRVNRTVVGKSLWVSTVWLGQDHNWGGGEPLIFETMVFGRWNYSELAMWRYSTEAEAQAGHVDAAAWAQRCYHGLVKHARDERRQRMKSDLAILADDSGSEMAEMARRLIRLGGRNPSE